MEKLKIDVLELTKWMSETWHLYASQMYKDKLLRLWANSTGLYRVEYGGEIIYEGRQFTHVLAAWDSV